MENPNKQPMGAGRKICYGGFWAVLLIPFIPVLIPLVLFFYLADMVDIVRNGPRRGRK